MDKIHYFKEGMTMSDLSLSQDTRAIIYAPISVPLRRAFYVILFFYNSYICKPGIMASYCRIYQ